MVINTRLRAILFPLALYVVSGGIGGYFVWTATNGERGLKSRVVYKDKIRVLEKELGALRQEHRDLDQRVAMLQANAIDRDLLEEESRMTLGRANRNDLVIMLPPVAGK